MIVMDGEQVTGFDRDMLDLISEQTGLQFIIRPANWTSVLEMGINREIDGLLYSSALPHRLKHFLFTVPYATFQAGFYGKLSDDYAYSLEKFWGSTIAVQKADHFSLGTIDSLHVFETVLFKDRIDIVKAVLSGEVDYFFGAMDMDYYLNSHGITGLKLIYSPAELQYDAVYSIRKDMPELVSIMNKSLSSIPQPSRNQLLQKWNFNAQQVVLLYRDLITSVMLIICGIVIIVGIWLLTLFKQIKE
ncbi:MAG: ABC-type amino acid transport substrate-binding protein [Cyclobacteriaceae bacterium]|jgi:ABC-type amino acid transport substrate-binding protein